MREKLIALSMVKKGDWNEIYHFLQRDRQLDSIDKEAAHRLVKELTCEAITLVDDDYPEAWRDMSKPPFVVYFRGDKALLSKKLVAVVGGKKPSVYTQRALGRLFSQLPDNIGVAGGLEIGVESHIIGKVNHQVTFFAAGIDEGDYYLATPPHSAFKSNDLVLSELPPGKTLDLSAYYRIYHLMCELSAVVCVFEMPTSDIRLKYLMYLLDLGKPIFVLPDRDKASSRGGLKLMRKGAKPLLGRSDILEAGLTDF